MKSMFRKDQEDLEYLQRQREREEAEEAKKKKKRTLYLHETHEPKPTEQMPNLFEEMILKIDTLCKDIKDLYQKGSDLQDVKYLFRYKEVILEYIECLEKNISLE